MMQPARQVKMSVYSLIVLLLTLVELGAAAGAYILHSAEVFSNVVVYGSPISLIMNLFHADSAWLDKYPVYLAFAAFHLIKYYCFSRALSLEEINAKRTIAVILEAVYLALSAFYIFS